MIRLSDTDYRLTDLSIRRAFVEATEEYGRPRPATEPAAIRWGDRDIVVGDILQVPERGRFRLQLISKADEPRQGADVDVGPGKITLPRGQAVALLRTWFDEEYEDVVEYEYESPRGLMRTCNVYEMKLGHNLVEDRWGDFAGMWIEELGPGDRIYHCSQGLSDPPNFNDLVYRLTVTG
jgi:hypothetical protein